MRGSLTFHHGLWRLAALLALAGAMLFVSADACAAPDAADLPSAGAADNRPVGCGGLTDDDWPRGPAPTFTEKPFWIMLGLVVLGWLVLAADFPENGSNHHPRA